VSRYVIDSSVVIKWHVPEVHSADALRYLDPSLERDAPELSFAEVSNALLIKVRRGELKQAEAENIADDVEQADIDIHPIVPLFKPALRLALATGRSAYDSIYLALADALSTKLVTADRKMYNALQNTPFARLVLWIEDGP